MNKPIHICIVTSVHPVDDVRVCNKFARTFRAAGYRVSWVGPDYAFFDSEHYDRYGIEYHLFPHKPGKLGRLMGPINDWRTGQLVSDVQAFYAPDPDSAWVAARLAQRKKTRAIFDIHEIFHDVMLDRWVKGPIAQAAKNILRDEIFKVCSRCDLVIGVSQVALDPYWAAKTEKMIVRSCAPAWFAEGDPANVCADGKKTFTFMHGKAHMSRGTQVVLEALSLAKKQVQGLRCIMIDISGSLSSPETIAFRRQVTALDLEDVVDLRPGIPMQEMPALLRTCDAGLIAYGRKLGLESLPNRIFEYMSIGLPVVVPLYSPEMCRILESEGCGLTADFEDPASVADVMVRMCQNPLMCREMGYKSRDAFEKRHNWEVEVQPLLDRIQSWYPDFG